MTRSRWLSGHTGARALVEIGGSVHSGFTAGPHAGRPRAVGTAGIEPTVPSIDTGIRAYRRRSAPGGPRKPEMARPLPDLRRVTCLGCTAFLLRGPSRRVEHWPGSPRPARGRT